MLNFVYVLTWKPLNFYQLLILINLYSFFSSIIFLHWILRLYIGARYI